MSPGGMSTPTRSPSSSSVGAQFLQACLTQAPSSGSKIRERRSFGRSGSAVLEGFPGLRVRPVILLRSPHEIAMSVCTRRDGRLAYWDCLDVVLIHLLKLRAIIDSCDEAPRRIRFGGPDFFKDLAAAVEWCGLTFDSQAAADMIDSSCIHHVAACVRHPSQAVYDALCGETSNFDAPSNLDRLIADARSCEKMALRRICALEDQTRRDQTGLLETRAQRDRAELLLREAYEEFARSQLETNRKEHEDRETRRELESCRADLSRLESEREDLLAEQERLSVQYASLSERCASLSEQCASLVQQCDDQRHALQKFENHPLVGRALKSAPASAAIAA